MIKLFHFTSGQHLPLIHVQGITKGVIPWSQNEAGEAGEVGMVGGWQWLTQNPDWQQDWARPTPASSLTFRRDEWRITVEIPEAQARRLVSWREMDRTRRPQSAEFINAFKDAPLWHLYKGPIPPDWFAAVDRNPIRRDLVLPENN